MLTLMMPFSLPAEVPIDSPDRGAAQFLPVEAVQLAVDITVTPTPELSNVEAGVWQSVEYLGAGAGPAGARPGVETGGAADVITVNTRRRHRVTALSLRPLKSPLAGVIQPAAQSLVQGESFLYLRLLVADRAEETVVEV